jgi:peptide deformylase
MALLSVLQFPDPNLRLKAQPVAQVDTAIKQIVADMFETMYEQGGVGLAATQVDIQQRIITIDVSDERNQPLCLINPIIIAQEGEVFEQEGCLSFPGVYDGVKRAANIQFQAQDVNGDSYTLAADGLLAICVQHEIDHLEGILFIDHLSRLRQERMRAKLTKIRRRTL